MSKVTQLASGGSQDWNPGRGPFLESELLILTTDSAFTKSHQGGAWRHQEAGVGRGLLQVPLPRETGFVDPPTLPALAPGWLWALRRRRRCSQPCVSLLSPRLSKAITSSIMALVCAINLYFVISYLPSLPHPAYFGLVALLAVAYLGLTTYLVL